MKDSPDMLGPKGHRWHGISFDPVVVHVSNLAMLTVNLLMLGKPEGRRRARQMVRWRRWLNGHETEQAPGDVEGQGGLACRSPWGCKEWDTTEQLNNKQELAQLCPCDCLGSNLGVQTGRAQRSVSLSHTLEARLEKEPNHLSDVAGKPQLLKKKKIQRETILFFYIILFIYPSCYFTLVRWSLSCIYCTILDIYSSDPQVSTKYQSVSTTLFLDIFKDVSLKKMTQLSKKKKKKLIIAQLGNADRQNGGDKMTLFSSLRDNKSRISGVFFWNSVLKLTTLALFPLLFFAKKLSRWPLGFPWSSAAIMPFRRVVSTDLVERISEEAEAQEAQPTPRIVL